MSYPSKRLCSALPLFLFLVVTLAFNLSSLPGHEARDTGAVTLASEVAGSFSTSECVNMINTIEHTDGQTFSCSINPDPDLSGDLAHVKGDVVVELADNLYTRLSRGDQPTTK